MTGDPRRAAPARWERLYGWLLRAYPERFRRRFEEGMRHAFRNEREGAQRRGRLALAALWSRTAVHALIFGGLERLRREGRRAGRRESRGPSRRERLRSGLRELRHAGRRLAHTPGFSLAALITLALAIGANTAIYSVVHGIVLSPLTYPESDRLVELLHSAPGAEIPRMGVDDATYFHYRRNSKTLEEIAAYRSSQVTLTEDGPPQRVDAAWVTASFFRLMLLRPPARGRFLTAEDDRPEAEPVAVISHRLWRARYGGGPAVVGRDLRLDGGVARVVGVMPAGFDFPTTQTDVWLPLRLDPEQANLGRFALVGIARTRPGVSVEEARAELQRLIPRLSETADPRSYDVIVERGHLSVLATSLKEVIVGDVERMLWILLGTVGFVLLIACANLANLFLVRAEGRRREVAVRTALGAGRGAVVRHFLSESLALGLAGGLAGLILAYVAIAALVRIGPASLPRLDDVAIDAPVLAFTAVISLLTGLLFGLLPALRYSAGSLVSALKDGGRGSTLGHERLHARNLLVVSQIALALVLLVGAGLMVRSFWQLKSVDPGFSARQALAFRLALPWQDYEGREVGARMHQRVIDRLGALPGVERVGAATCLPLTGCRNTNPMMREGMVLGPGEIPPAVLYRGVTEGYFEAMGIPLRAGRTIERSDAERRSGAVVVNETLAQRFWPGASAIGKRVYPSLNEPNWYTIVGVVGDVHTDGLIDEPRPTAYFPLVGTDDNEMWGSHSLVYVVRTDGPPLQLADPIRSAIWELDPNLPIADVSTLHELVTHAEGPMAFAMLLLGIAALVALLLGAIGVYGVLSYVVSQRRGEIGVRLALGARAGDVSRMILRQGALVAAAGVALGLGGALALTRLMGALLYNVAATDAPTYAGVTLVLLGVTLLASYLPARRAARQDPVDALKAE